MPGPDTETETMVTNLTPTQMKVLAAAVQREDGNIEPLPSEGLHDAGKWRCLDALEAKGMIEKRDGAHPNGVTHLRFITALGLETIGGVADADAKDEDTTDETAPSAATEAAMGARKGKGARQPRRPRKAAPAGSRAQRTGTKQDRLIAMLRRPDGDSIEEIAAAFSWEKHTVRGAIAGALKRKLGLDVQSERVDGRGTVYRLPNV
jgi:hypothetical protein